MTLYEDELAFWDDISARYILKHAGTDRNFQHIIEAAAFYADAMILERRKRKRIKNTVASAAVGSSEVTAAA